MSISILLAEKIAQLFLILLMGYLVVRVGLLKPEDSRVLSVIMVYLVMPCMILNAFQIDNTPEVRTGIAYSFVVAGITTPASPSGTKSNAKTRSNNTAA